ncbi:MAG: outer membrane lipoprotein carrier protein LolA [Porphyromonadaceae bacterium]|nr:MAG: outer membrane lipoprotein carrier protein LolA [Porphyromonadaceae bacterium]
MNKLTTILFSIIILPFTLHGQNPADTKSLMDRVSKKLQSYTTIKADFSFTLSNPEEKINDTHEGSLFMNGSKYRLSIMGILALCDGETLWTVNQELKEANIIDPDENEMFNPKSIFTLYEKHFKYEPVAVAGDKVTVDLVPTGKEETYLKIRMDILKSKDQIDQVTYYSKDGNQYIIKIKSFSSNIPADDRMFIFNINQFPGVKVFDMR